MESDRLRRQLRQPGAAARLSRSSPLAELGKQYCTAASARGIGRWRLVLCNALPNAIVPVVALLGNSLGRMLGGSVIVESIFALPASAAMPWTLSASGTIRPSRAMCCSPARYMWPSRSWWMSSVCSGPQGAVWWAEDMRKRNFSLQLVFAVTLLALIFLSSLLAPYDPTAIDTTVKLQGPSAAHWLGADSSGTCSAGCCTAGPPGCTG